MLQEPDIPPPAETAPRPARWTFAHVVSFVAVTLFVATEVVAAYGAGVWALSGLIGLNLLGTEVLAALLAVPALYAILKCAQLAFAAEMDPAND